MFWFKGCAKCGGDLFMKEEDWQCLQCGAYQYGVLPWSRYLRQDLVEAEKPRRRRNRVKNGLKRASSNGVVHV